MSDMVKIRVEISDDALQDKLRAIGNDDTVRLQLHNLLAQMCDPYVPMESGTLAQTTEITPQYVRYTQPYAHYQYTGVVYGPNIPIIENGIIVGWWSKPNKKPTGKNLTYSHEAHPLATSQWDKAMLRDKREEFVERATEIVKRRLDDG